MKKHAFLEAAKQWYRDYKIADDYHTFSSFVESLKRPEHESLIESIQTGIKTLSNSNNCNANTLMTRLFSICESVEDDELEVEDSDLIASMNQEDIDDIEDEEGSIDKDEGEVSVGSIEREEKKKKREESKVGTRSSHVSDKSSLSQKYSMLKDAADSKRPEERMIGELTPYLIQIAEKYTNSDVQESVFAGLLQWALSQRDKFDPDAEFTKKDGTKVKPKFVSFIMNSRTEPNKAGKRFRWVDLKAAQLADRARGIVRRSWREGVRPSTPYTVMFRGNYYQLKPEVVGKIKTGDKRLMHQPHTPEGKEIWEEISKEEYMNKMGADPSIGQQTSVSSPVGGDSEDMTQEEKIASKGLGDAKSRSRELLDQLQTELTDMNEWAKKTKEVKPFKDDILKMMKLKLANPDITEEELFKNIPSLPLRPGSSSKGKIKLHPQLMTRANEKLQEFLYHPKWEKYREFADLLSELELERDEISTAL